jgi:ABC-type uncharacterized transport system permease subunit
MLTLGTIYYFVDIVIFKNEVHTLIDVIFYLCSFRMNDFTNLHEHVFMFHNNLGGKFHSLFLELKKIHYLALKLPLTTNSNVNSSSKYILRNNKGCSYLYFSPYA